jgi:2-methylcitrate dehydratase PrpD
VHPETYSTKLSKFVYYLDYNSLKEEVIEKAKLCLLDFIGVSLFGSDTDLARTTTNTMKSMGGIKESTIIGDDDKLPCMNAAFVNGVAAHIHELDDGHRFAMGHPGIPVISAALAAAEKIESSGRDLIAAIIAGYEVFVRIGSSINPSHFERGFHTTGTCGSFGATASAGKILHLNADELTNALGIAGIQAAGLMEVTKGASVIKPLQPGKAAQNGILSVLLAKGGITAPESILEGVDGFCRATSDEYDLQSITKGLGDNFEIMRSYFKFHSSCRHTHPTIDATLRLVSEHNIRAEEVAEVRIHTYSAALNLCGKEYEPKTVSTAKFSIPYCVSVAILEGKVHPDTFTIEKIRNKNILDFAKKVKIEIDPEIEKYVPAQRGARVEIMKTNGEKHECYITNPYGEPEVPATPTDVKNKFVSLSTRVVTTERANKIKDLVDRLDTLDSLKELIEYLSP